MRKPATAAAAWVLASFLGGCTVVKPVIGALTGPVVILAQPSYHHGGNCHDEGAVYALVALAAVGAAVGLVTGVVSDYQALTGAVEEPTANWWNPFATNSQVCATH
jgi:TRAP-type C4-dicarboxylate transport system permease small subunit